MTDTMPTPALSLGLALALGLVLAGAADAEAAPAFDPIRAAAFRSAPNLSPIDILRPAGAPVPATGADALPKRSIDLRFAPRDVTGSIGFLCGREPGHNDTGSAAAFGSDPHGRFLGARLSRAF